MKYDNTGQKVVCINDKQLNSNPVGGLKEGDTYTIEEDLGFAVYLKEVKAPATGHYYKNRFRIATLEELELENIPEKWAIEVTEDNLELCNEYRVLISNGRLNLSLSIGATLLYKHLTDQSYFYLGSIIGVFENSNYSDYKQITTEQLQIIVNNLKSKPMETKLRKFTAYQGQQMIDAACSTWKDNLVKVFGWDIVLRKDITITEEFYKEIRKACNATQNLLLDSIFGVDKEVIPDGTLCWVKFGTHSTYKFQRYSDGKGEFYIDGRKSGHTADFIFISVVTFEEEFPL